MLFVFSIPHSRFRYIVVNSQFFIYISSSLSSRFTIWLKPLVVMWVYISVVLLQLWPLLSQVFQIPGSSFGDSRNLGWKSWQFVTAILSSSSNQFQMETKWHPVFSGLSIPRRSSCSIQTWTTFVAASQSPHESKSFPLQRSTLFFYLPTFFCTFLQEIVINYNLSSRK